MLRFIKSLFGGGAAAPLDQDLVSRIRDNLKREPSDHLHAMLDPSAAGKYSPEAVLAANILLEQRAHNLAPEPKYRTAPRTAQEQAARQCGPVAPRFNRNLLALDVGSRVYCPWRKQDGTIIRWDDKTEDFYIRYDNGDGDWATFPMFLEF